MSEWDFLTLQEAGIQLIDCVHKTPAAQSEGMPYIAIPQMQNGELELSSARKISAGDFEEWTKKADPKPFDIVLSRRCNPGETAYVRPGMRFALGQNLVLLRADGKRVRPQFLRWMVRSPYWWSEIGKFINVGAVFDSLRCADVPKFSLPVPPLREQDAIASLLGALDDKIELNRRTTATLQALAQALFFDWFVAFGPTRAKMRGDRRYLSADIWALFPKELDDTGKPNGWQEGILLEQATLISGGTPKTDISEYWNGSIAWASAKDVSQCGEPFLVKTERTISELGLENSCTKIIPRLSTVVVARGATTGRYCMFGRDIAMNQTCYALHNTRRPFWLNLAFGHAVSDLVHSGHGSVFNTITTRTFGTARVIVASEPVMASFESLVAPLFSRILTNVEESVTLAELRGLLLPKLMSGEIRLRAAQKRVEEVA